MAAVIIFIRSSHPWLHLSYSTQKHQVSGTSSTEHLGTPSNHNPFNYYYVDYYILSNHLFMSISIIIYSVIYIITRNCWQSLLSKDTQCWSWKLGKSHKLPPKEINKYHPIVRIISQNLLH